jgi:hypothetical protein
LASVFAVRLIDGKDRVTSMLQSIGEMAEDAAREPQRWVTLACKRRFSAGAKVVLVYGKGVATPPSDGNFAARHCQQGGQTL